MPVLLKSGGVALPVFASDTVEFQPRTDGPTYRLRVPTFRTSRAFRQALLDGGIRIPGDADIRAELRTAVRTWVVDDEQPGALAKIDLLEAGLKAREDNPDGEADPELESVAREVAEMQSQLRAVHKPLAKMQADQMYGIDTMHFLLAQHFLAGWDGLEAEFEADPRTGRLTEAATDRVPMADIPAIGARVLELQTLSGKQEKNSASPSPSMPARQTSRAARKRRTAAHGASSGKPSGKTRD